MDIKFQDRTDIIRRSNAVVNVDKDAYFAYINKRNADELKEKTIQNLTDELDLLKQMFIAKFGEYNAKE